MRWSASPPLPCTSPWANSRAHSLCLPPTGPVSRSLASLISCICLASPQGGWWYEHVPASSCTGLQSPVLNRQVLNSINTNRKVPVYFYSYAYVDRHLAFLGKLYLEVYLNTLSAIVPEMELVWSLCFVCECVSACSRKSNPSQSLTLLQECFQCLSWAASVSQPPFYPTPMP